MRTRDEAYLSSSYDQLFNYNAREVAIKRCGPAAASIYWDLKEKGINANGLPRTAVVLPLEDLQHAATM